MFVLLRNRRTRLHRDGGYTLVELLMTIAIIGVVGGMAAGVSASFVNRSRADSSVQAFMTQLELARTRAISERRNFELTFQLPNRIVVRRAEIVNGVVQEERTPIADTELDNQLVYKQFTGLPDTPDAFGNSGAIDFDGTGPIQFTSDGSLVDSAGELSNATIFLGANGSNTDTARAVTIMGATGLIKSFAWGKTHWIGQ
jgi:prepilin-type N-terminal cleavage/methylation domain-containing protein